MSELNMTVYHVKLITSLVIGDARMKSKEESKRKFKHGFLFCFDYKIFFVKLEKENTNE